jgi:hypothetical protein
MKKLCIECGRKQGIFLRYNYAGMDVQKAIRKSNTFHFPERYNPLTLPGDAATDFLCGNCANKRSVICKVHGVIKDNFSMGYPPLCKACEDEADHLQAKERALVKAETRRLVIYVGIDDEIRSPLFSLYEKIQDWTRAKFEATQTLTQSYKDSRFSTQFDIPKFELLHDLEFEHQMTVWSPFQLARNGHLHPEIAKKGAIIGPEVKRCIIDVEESYFPEVVNAWLMRRTFFAQREYALAYNSAMNLVEQMSVLNGEGLSHKTTLCLYRMCAEEMPSIFCSDGSSDFTSEPSQRNAYFTFLEFLTGVPTRGLYTVYSPLSEDDPIPIVESLLEEYEIDQFIIEDCRTSVVNFEIYLRKLGQNNRIIDLRGECLS